MLRFPHEDKLPAIPAIPADTRIAPTAVVSGDVTVGHNCSIGFGAVLTAESGPISIGDNCVVMDGAVLRGIRGNPLCIGDNVLIGPRAYLTGCTIEQNVFIATGATIFNRAVVGEHAEVRINGIVHIRTRLLRDAVVPLGWIASATPQRSCRRMRMSASGRSRSSSTSRATCSEWSARRRARPSCPMSCRVTPGF